MPRIYVIQQTASVCISSKQDRIATIIRIAAECATDY